MPESAKYPTSCPLLQNPYPGNESPVTVRRLTAFRRSSALPRTFLLRQSLRRRATPGPLEKPN